jgi:3-isopropylmalate dehydrogenase
MGMKKHITVIEGDGIGPEVTRQAIQVLNAIAQEFHHEFTYQHALMGAVAIDETGKALPEATVEACMQSDAVLLGAIGHPRYDNDPTATHRPEQALLQLRQRLQLYANIRPIESYPALQHLSAFKADRIEGVDFLFVRELTGGIYFGDKTLSADGNLAIDPCIYERSQIERVALLAFQYAQKRKHKLTLIDKSNVLVTSKLWRKVVMEIATEFPEVEVTYMYVDNAAMQLIQDPRQFDVILTENMFGDILSDEASMLSGSIGMVPSAAIGKGTALFEPVHGAYPQAAGKDIANPIGAILSAALMLDYFGLNKEAEVMRQGVNWTLKHGFVTKDIDPTNFYFTSTIGELICDFVAGKIPGAIHKDNIELRKSTII